MNSIPPEYLNQIVTGDARELAKRIPDKCAALAFADPPYWVGYNYGNKTDRDMDYIDPLWLANELQRVAVVAAITPGIINSEDYPKPDWKLAWFKFGSTGRSGIGGFNVWEPILIYGKCSKRFWQDAINLPQWNNLSDDSDFHKCPKPLKLLTWLIEGMTDANDLVIDFTCGSGTTCKAAKMLGRNYIAFEIDPNTAERARERVRNTQPPLFVLQPEQTVMELAE